MSRKKKILLIIAVGIATLLGVNHRWVGYLAHLAKHQYRVILYKEKITERLKRPNLSEEERRILNMTLSIRKFAELSYDLKNSTSYQSYYDLGRKELGFNITVAPALSLKPESFRFWPIGSFDYLGFFDRAYAESWASTYREKGFDVHLSEIGGYSTLGWFEDPLYSSQLSWGEYGLARLLGHEIAHEKLYFRDDTTFSELLASFIERKLALDYLIAQGRKIPSEAEIRERRRRAETFADLIAEIKKELEQVYSSALADKEKLERKRQIISKLRKNLEKRKDDFSTFAAAHELSQLREINNATLVQFHRYSAQGKAFELLYEGCKKLSPQSIYTCWFGELAKLKPCSREVRKAWLLGDGKIPTACSGA